MGTPVCRVEDSFDPKKLRVDGSDGTTDPCLENNFFEPIPLTEVRTAMVDGKPVTEVFYDSSHVTWYANGFENKPTKSGLMFKAHDFTIAVTDDLKSRFPVGSLVKATYLGKSVIVHVTDRKPPDKKADKGLQNHSVDFSKGAAYELGGYDLLQKGIIAPIILELVEPNCDSRFEKGDKIDPRSICLQDNIFLSIKTGLFKISPNGRSSNSTPDPKAYGAIIDTYVTLDSFLDAFTDNPGLTNMLSSIYFSGGKMQIRPELELRLVQQYRIADNGKAPDTFYYWDIRLTGISSHEDAAFWKAMIQQVDPSFDIVEGQEPWQEYTKSLNKPSTVIPYPYHANDPASLEPLDPKRTK